jgi:hypothetical protein
MATGRARRRQRYVACRATRVRPDDWFQIPKLPLATWSRNGSSEPRSKRSRLASAADDRSPANAAPHQPATWNQPSRVRGGRLVSRERISTGPSRACSIRTSAAYRLGRAAGVSIWRPGRFASPCRTAPFSAPRAASQPEEPLLERQDRTASPVLKTGIGGVAFGARRIPTGGARFAAGGRRDSQFGLGAAQ